MREVLRDQIARLEPRWGESLNPHVILAFVPSRTHMEELQLMGTRSSPARQVGKCPFLWALPYADLSAADATVRFAGLIGPESTACLGAVKVVSENLLKDMEEVTETELRDMSRPGSPAVQVLRTGMDFLLSSLVWLLNHRLCQAEADAGRSSARKRFLAMDFVTNKEIHRLLLDHSSGEEILDGAKQQARDLFPMWRWGEDHPDTTRILDYLLQAVPLRRELQHFEYVMQDALQDRFERSADRIYQLKWSGRTVVNEDMRPFPEALEHLFEYFRGALGICGGLASPSADAMGLMEDLDLVRFASGELQLGKDQGHEILNCEPNSALFFSFAEFFLMRDAAGRRGDGRSDSPVALSWARAAIAAEYVFIHYYRMPSEAGGEADVMDFSHLTGPRNGPPRDEVYRAAFAFVDSLPREHEALRVAHHQLVEAGKTGNLPGGSGPRGPQGSTPPEAPPATV